tara:strand:+ start:2254 stop:3144 length:891 start_codon:yes stop_codon:yes gene_type:complete
MNRKELTTICMVFLAAVVCARANASGFALMGIPKIEKGAYEAQLPKLITQAGSQLTRTETIEVFENELEIAPLVLSIDFQRKIKLEVNARALAEYRAWLGEYGFQELATVSDEKLSSKLDAILTETYPIADEAQEVAESPDSWLATFFPVSASNINQKVGTENHDVVAFEEGGISAENTLAATNLVAVDGEAVVFFPYVNMSFHKQGTGVSQLDGEVVLNYIVEMNGYFELCIPQGCVSAQLPKDVYLNFTAPLVHYAEITSEESHDAVYEYGIDLLAEVVSDFCVEGLKTLSGRN